MTLFKELKRLENVVLKCLKKYDLTEREEIHLEFSHPDNEDYLKLFLLLNEKEDLIVNGNFQEKNGDKIVLLRVTKLKPKENDDNNYFFKIHLKENEDIIERIEKG